MPTDFHPPRKSEFDTQYMNAEFNLAYNLARPGYKWHKYPPGYVPAPTQESALPVTGALVRD